MSCPICGGDRCSCSPEDKSRAVMSGRTKPRSIDPDHAPPKPIIPTDQVEQKPD